MTIPGARRINPDEEAARLARERQDPPNREWAVRHPNGKITVSIGGHPFMTRAAAEEDRATCERGECDTCDGGPHTLAYRDRQPWREAP